MMNGLCFVVIALWIITVDCKKQKNIDRKSVINIDDVKFLKKIIKTHTNLLVLFAQTEKDASEKLDLLGTLGQEFKGKGTVSFVNCGCLVGEWSFSILKRLKNYLRATMGQERMSNRSLLSIEHGMLDLLPMDEIIYDFGSLKARKKTF